MSDPLERAKLLLDEAARERDTLRHQKVSIEAELHQVRRRLARAEDGYREVNDLNTELRRQLEQAEQRVQQAQRAMLDHVARS